VTSPYNQLPPPTQLETYIAELKRLLAAGGLTPDTRARCLASLIDAEVLPGAAQQLHQAVESATWDTLPQMTSAATRFAEAARPLTEALTQALGRLPDR